jgi:hypothetical protein
VAVLAALAALVFLAPAVALADSAGDQQYIDPLAGNTTSTPSHSSPAASSPSSSSSSSSSSSTGSSAGASAPSSPAPATTATTAQASTSSSSSGSTSTSAAAATSRPTLPFTGLDVWLCVAVGGGLLGAGLALRRLARTG